jgi:hypothetical protein
MSTTCGLLDHLFIRKTLPKVTAKNRAHTWAFYIISAQVTPKIALVWWRKARAHWSAVSPPRRNSPLAAAASTDTANNMHNVNLHNRIPLVHILLKSNPPLRRAISHLHSHSRTRSNDLRNRNTSTYTSPKNCHLPSTRFAFPKECNSSQSH